MALLRGRITCSGAGCADAPSRRSGATATSGRRARFPPDVTRSWWQCAGTCATGCRIKTSKNCWPNGHRGRPQSDWLHPWALSSRPAQPGRRVPLPAAILTYDTELLRYLLSCDARPVAVDHSFEISGRSGHAGSTSVWCCAPHGSRRNARDSPESLTRDVAELTGRSWDFLVHIWNTRGSAVLSCRNLKATTP
jgi:hypothetical protein